MKGTNVNDKGKVEKNKNVLVGECIFPFQYKKNKYDTCAKTEKGNICATSVSKRGTLKTYAYCPKISSSTKKLIKKNTNSRSTRKSSMKTRSSESPSITNSTKVVKSSQNSKQNSKLNSKKSSEKILKTNSPLSLSKMSSDGKSEKLETVANKRLNEIFVSALSELNDIFLRKGEAFRGRAYKKAEETILLQPHDITDYSEMKDLPNIGDTILSKLKELQETGTLRVLERERKDPLQIFTQIHGIGPKKAQSLIDKDMKTIDDLRDHLDLLNDNQKLGLQYYEDIHKRIPRSIIDEYKTVFENSIKEFGDDKINFEIVGSYRRGAKTSGDIDIIISHTDDDASVFSKLLSKFQSEGIIKEFLTKGKVKSLTITKLPDDIARRVDFLYAPSKELAFAVLYFTGSMGFNTVMRHKALQMGYTLNEHGISKMHEKAKGEQISFMDFPTEESIFEFFQMEYKKPEERVDGRSVVSKNGSPVIMKHLKTLKKTMKKTKEAKPVSPKETKETKSVSPKETKEAKPVSPKETKETKSVSPKEAKPEQKSAASNPKTPKATERKSSRTSTMKSSVLDTFVNDFRSKGMRYLKTLKEAELEKVLEEANQTFFNNVSVLTDSEYDIVKEYMETTYSSNKMVKEIGAIVADKNKVKLPYYMGSMDKIKPDTNAIVKWKQKYSGPYVISAKLDGVSGLYSTENDDKKLYTRGDGKVGQDISYLVPYLRLPDKKDIVIRGEFIINRHTFDDKYASKFSNPRNFVSGMINSKSVDAEKFADIEFVAYEVIMPELVPSEQMKMLEDINVANVINEIQTNVDNEMLSKMLVSWRETYKFESDGIIVTNDKIYDRVNKNPDHSFAFKMVLSEQMAEAKVVDVIWKASKDGYLKPKVQIEPVVLGGATIQYATAHNASTVVAKKLGVGAVIKIIRSGDVIPYIMDTIVPAEVVKMPDEEYVWNETNVDILLVNKSDNKDMLNKNITGFFTGIEVDGLSTGNVSRIIDSGYNSVAKIISMSKEDFLTVEGFKEKLATKIHDSIHSRLKVSSIETIMSSSNIFGHGFGDRKIKLIMKAVPDILTSQLSEEEKINTLKDVKGMAKKSAQHFVEKIHNFNKFLGETGLQYKLQEENKVVSNTYDTKHPLYSKAIVFTGIREKNLMQLLENKFDVKLASSVSKSTFAVISKSKDDDGSKLNKARSMDIPIYEIEEFKEKFSL